MLHGGKSDGLQVPADTGRQSTPRHPHPHRHSTASPRSRHAVSPPGTAAVSLSPCWIAIHACPDGRPLAIVWLANHSSRRSRCPIAVAVERGLARRTARCPTSPRSAGADCRCRASRVEPCDCAAGAVVGSAAPYDFGLAYRRRFESGLGAGPGIATSKSWPFSR